MKDKIPMMLHFRRVVQFIGFSGSWSAGSFHPTLKLVVSSDDFVTSDVFVTSDACDSSAMARSCS